METIKVDHRKLFDAEFDYNDVGTVRPNAKKLLDRIRKKHPDAKIVITGSVTEGPFGRRALLTALYDNDLPFDEIANA